MIAIIIKELIYIFESYIIIVPEYKIINFQLSSHFSPKSNSDLNLRDYKV